MIYGLIIILLLILLFISNKSKKKFKRNYIEINKTKENLNNEIDKLKEENHKLKVSNINFFKPRNRNTPILSEDNFQQSIKDPFEKNSLKKPYFFYSNINFPNHNNLSKIEYMLICEYGVFIFSTKNWEGTTYITHVSNPQIPTFIKNAMSEKNNNYKSGKYIVYNDKANYQNPIKEIQNLAINFKKFLDKELKKNYLEYENLFIEPVLSFCQSFQSELKIFIKEKKNNFYKKDAPCMIQTNLNKAEHTVDIIEFTKNEKTFENSIEVFIEMIKRRKPQLKENTIYNINEIINKLNSKYKHL